ncbi:putative methyltransferase YcgJ [compost metagenome]
MKNRTNQTKYRILAPVYDHLMGHRNFRTARQRALTLLEIEPSDRILLVGVGTGEDLAFLPPATEAVGVDLSEAMLEVARAKFPTVEFQLMNAESLDYPDDSFDKVVLNLVLSVVEHPDQALAEALRILKPDGKIVVFDKFLIDGGRPSLVRQAFNVITSWLGTDINRRFDEISRGLPLETVSDEPSLFGGSYRILLLEKARQPVSQLVATSHR